MNISTIYEVSGSVGMDGSTHQHWHYTATKREAEQYIRETKDNWDHCDLEISPVAVTVTRKGIVDELNGFIGQTCINEG